MAPTPTPRRRRLPPLFCSMQTPSPPPTLSTLKVCGLVSAADAHLTTTVTTSLLPPQVQLLLGTIVSPHSKRSVYANEAHSIARVAHDAGAIPVAVFVDETADQIQTFCHDCGFQVAQLHGKGSRQSVRQSRGFLRPDLRFIDVRDVSHDGTVLDEPEVDDPLWCLYDAKGGGTGVAFDWQRFQRPKGPWLLAGGLHEGNVEQAVQALAPDGLDVATGVAGDDTCRKDADKLRRFVEKVVAAYRV
eukprot:GFKZ01015847.1.p1 GENE.GFKZ01015847.1~~GFKZ01015847.1.p1  ORF type:complete len:245 (-),score=23.82 GFKZ01015847.1:336-1070(-)